MQANVTLGRIAGIPIGLHYSWLIIATLITLSLTAEFHLTNPEWGPAIVWSAAVLTALLFFASLVAHELSHALVAGAQGIPVRSITLFALGGVAQIDKNAGSARAEFRMAIAGPITSAVIGLACLAGASAMGWTPTGGTAGPAGAVLGWLGSINLILAVFNLIPGYPLDGGRVLRAALWAWSGNLERATTRAAAVGQIVAGLFILLGLLRFFAGQGFGGLWLAFIGWFLLDASRASALEVTLERTLRDLHAGDVMGNDCDTVSAREPLAGLVDRLLRTGRRCFMVAQDDGELVGLVTPQEVRAVDRARWPELTVGDIMRSLAGLATVSRATPVVDALRLMSRADVNQLPVVDNGHVEGVITRGHILRVIQARSELRI